MVAEELIGKRVRMPEGYATVVAVRRRDQGGRTIEPLCVIRYDDFDSPGVVLPSVLDRLPDERGRRL